MNRTNRRRLKKVAKQVEATPIAPAIVDSAFHQFLETGELPEHQRLAASCIERALNDGRPGSRCTVLAESRRALRALAAEAEGREPEPERESVRELLFHEAVYGWEVVRMAARSAIKVLVAIGLDPEDPDFVDEDMELPDWGGVGLHLLGFPECLVKPPYKRQAGRLFRRMEGLRQRIDRDDREWMDAYGEAAVRFLHEGVLPGDELMVEAVLAYGELIGLVAHYVGVGDAEVMDAYDRATRAKGRRREEANCRVQNLVRGGRLFAGIE